MLVSGGCDSNFIMSGDSFLFELSIFLELIKIIIAVLMM